MIDEKNTVDRLAEIVESPLKYLERWFSELAAGMTSAGDAAEAGVEGSSTQDEKFAQIIIMVHSRGIATGMEMAAAEIAKARATVRESLEEVKEALS